MKIAVISDIHGNIEALEAVLADIEKEEIQKIFVCGDLAMAGPNPVETVDRLIRLSREKEVSIIQGNTDQMILKSYGQKGDGYTPGDNTMRASLKYTQDILREDQIEFLKSLPEQKVEKTGELNILLTHGSPRNISENILPDISEEALGEIIKDRHEDIIFCGHTHLPVIFRLSGQTVVNTGSVGRPFTENPEACYAILEVKEEKDFDIRHKFVEYDRETTAKKLESLSFEGSGKLARVILSPNERLKLFS